MSQKDTQIAMLLKLNGLSVTKQRLAVFRLLEGREPVSMSELYELAKHELDRASLYRTVNAYERLGIIRRVNLGWKYKIELSDTFTGHHHHLTCLRCHEIIPINERELEMFINTLSEQHKFKPLEHQIEVQGHCTDCI